MQSGDTYSAEQTEAPIFTIGRLIYLALFFAVTVIFLIVALHGHWIIAMIAAVIALVMFRYAVVYMLDTVKLKEY